MLNKLRKQELKVSLVIRFVFDPPTHCFTCVSASFSTESLLVGYGYWEPSAHCVVHLCYRSDSCSVSFLPSCLCTTIWFLFWLVVMFLFHPHTTLSLPLRLSPSPSLPNYLSIYVGLSFGWLVGIIVTLCHWLDAK